MIQEAPPLTGELWGLFFSVQQQIKHFCLHGAQSLVPCPSETLCCLRREKLIKFALIISNYQEDAALLWTGSDCVCVCAYEMSTQLWCNDFISVRCDLIKRPITSLLSGGSLITSRPAGRRLAWKHDDNLSVPVRL